MNDAELKTLFRANELQERQRRRESLLQRIKNEGDLLYEDLDADAIEATMRAVHNIARQEDLYRDIIERNKYTYWQRLWRAITNKGAQA